jgi:formylmethanofuran dehydrogenase subunit E
MTRFEHLITSVRCNYCDSLRIHWTDEQTDTHLCKPCYEST